MDQINKVISFLQDFEYRIVSRPLAVAILDGVLTLAILVLRAVLVASTVFYFYEWVLQPVLTITFAVENAILAAILYLVWLTGNAALILMFRIAFLPYPDGSWGRQNWPAFTGAFSDSGGRAPNV